jgi:hypothetical protein
MLRLTPRTLLASTMLLIAASSGCGQRLPSSPSLGGLAVTAVSPNIGLTDGTTVVTISGSGFQPGATVSLDGLSTHATFVSSTSITATPPAHTAGWVELVVTNPDGQKATLFTGYRYVAGATPSGAIPSVTTVFPNRGTTAGGTPVSISGNGFQAGATVTIGGAVATAYYVNSNRIEAFAPARAAGMVGVVVTNPDGQTATVAGGYTYASPQSFDFNGAWRGGAGTEFEIDLVFTVRNDLLISFSCGKSPAVAVVPPVAVSSGEFSFLGNDGTRFSGTILADDLMAGSISLPLCTATTRWIAWREQ